MADYRITRRAQADLEEIWAYTVGDWSLNQANRYLEGLLACFEAVATGETPGKAVEDLRSGYRKILYGRHCVFYRLGSDQVAEIIRVLHGSMDMESRL